MSVELDALGLRCRLGSRQRDGKNRVGTQRFLVLGTVQRQHGIVQRALVECIHAHEALADRAIDGFDCLQHALAQITALVAITQFQRFTRTGGGTGRSAGTGALATLQHDLGLYGRVTTGIEHLKGADFDDIGHLVSSSTRGIETPRRASCP